MTTRGCALRMSNRAERGACGVRQACHDFSRNGLRLDLARMIGIGRSPDSLLETLHGELARLQNAVVDREARTAPLPHFALHDDLIVEAPGRKKPRALLHQGQAENAADLAHFGRAQSRSR